MSNYDPTIRLKELFPGGSEKFEFTPSDAVATMVLIRELVEFRNRKKDLSVLNLYCNWTVHPEPLGFLIGCRFLAGAAAAYGAKHDVAALGAYVNTELSLPALRTELIETFKTHGVPTRNLEFKIGWKIFCTQYFKSLAHKRIQFPAKMKAPSKMLEAYEEMQTAVKNDVSRIAQSIRFETAARGAVQWLIEFKDGSEVSGPLENP